MPNLLDKIGTAIEDRLRSWWEEFTGAIDGRFKLLENRVSELESKLVKAIAPSQVVEPTSAQVEPAQVEQSAGESH